MVKEKPITGGDEGGRGEGKDKIRGGINQNMRERRNKKKTREKRAVEEDAVREHDARGRL